MNVMLAKKATTKAIESLLLKDSFVLVQEKYDGVRCLIKDHKAYTRHGKEIIFPANSNIKLALAILNPKYVYDGELLIANEKDDILPRKEISGLVNKGLHSNLTEEEANSFRLVLWDSIYILDYKYKHSSEEYVSRLDNLSLTLNYFNDIWSILYNQSKINPIRLTSSFNAFTPLDITSIFNWAITKEKEGIMIKLPSAPWEPKRVNHMLKLKQELSADLRVMGYIPGTGKYEGMLGALICNTDDGCISVRVGSGFTDSQRELCNAPPIGSIVEVKYNAVISQYNSNIKSLFLPIYKGVRFDKNHTNSIEEL